ncbi:MAG TPA: acyl-CoA synthetase, partial [Gemmatimonadetes bacterium]|nr:acyl-CoA synthetase [Gemmatimonadota bacterium]
MSQPNKEVYRHELLPTHFLERAGDAYADRIAVVDGEVEYTWRDFRTRARRFASALQAQGLEKGDRIAFLALNSEPLLLAHFGVPLAGGTLVSINTRLTSAEIGYILEQSGSTKVFYSPELRDQIPDTLSGVALLNVEDEFEDLLSQGGDDALPTSGFHEDETLAINYTSGTTGRPKGVMYHHRGAYLNALAMVLDQRLTADSVYLWTLPMFHCNGWTFTWGVAAVGATSICIPRIDPTDVWRRFDEGVTHFCAAPTVLTMLANDPAAHRLERPVRLFTAGAPPSPTLIAQMATLNFELKHTYGLTETYGPCTINVAPPSLANQSKEEQSRHKARQGFANVCTGEVSVVDADMQPVPDDGETMGEVVMRGNIVMKGYYEDVEATEQAFAGGWFHSGDIAVLHPDGSIELRDRKKDIIISGGENISTVEVEQAVVSHPAVMECAVVPIPHEKWGEQVHAIIRLA